MTFLKTSIIVQSNLKALTYIVSICLAMWLGGCSSDERQSTRIPPLPSDDALKRAEIGVEYLSAIIRRSPRNALNYHRRAELYIVLKNFPAALTDINDALEISSSNGLFLLTKARILRQIKRYDEALAAARRAEVLQQYTPDL